MSLSCYSFIFRFLLYINTNGYTNKIDIWALWPEMHIPQHHLQHKWWKQLMQMRRTSFLTVFGLSGLVSDRLSKAFFFLGRMCALNFLKKSFLYTQWGNVSLWQIDDLTSFFLFLQWRNLGLLLLVLYVGDQCVCHVGFCRKILAFFHAECSVTYSSSHRKYETDFESEWNRL